MEDPPRNTMRTMLRMVLVMVKKKGGEARRRVTKEVLVAEGAGATRVVSKATRCLAGLFRR